MISIGIDIGGTQLRTAVLDEGYQLKDVCKIPTDQSLNAAQNLDKMISFINSRRAAHPDTQVKGIGVCCPGPLDLKKGSTRTLPNLVGWDNFPIVDYISRGTGLPVCLNNDGNAAGLAEAVLGEGKDSQSVVFVGVSTGIGGAYIYNKKIVSGAHCNAAELWTMLVNEDPHTHKNGFPGVMNEQCSGSGITRLASDYFERNMSAKEIFALYAAGDPLAAKVVNRAADALARGFANISCTFDPELIIVGGSVAIHNPGYIRLAEKMAAKYMPVPEYLCVRPARFGDDAGLIGAALLLED